MLIPGPGTPWDPGGEPVGRGALSCRSWGLAGRSMGGGVGKTFKRKSERPSLYLKAGPGEEPGPLRTLSSLALHVRGSGSTFMLLFLFQTTPPNRAACTYLPLAYERIPLLEDLFWGYFSLA